MITDIDALIAVGTRYRIPLHFAFHKTQSTARAATHAVSTMVAVVDGVWIMTSDAIEIAPLEEQHQAISWSINTRKGQHTADLRLFFCLIIFNPSHLSC